MKMIDSTNKSMRLVEICLVVDLDHHYYLFNEPDREPTARLTADKNETIICGVLVSNHSDDGFSESVLVRFAFYYRDDEYQGCEKVQLTRYFLHHGGHRYFFLCPQCNNRVRVLYAHPDDVRLGCRTCHKLTYKSTRTSHLLERIINFAKQADPFLWQSFGNESDFPEKVDEQFIMDLVRKKYKGNALAEKIAREMIEEEKQKENSIFEK
jgi:hypothetical protein